MLTPSGSGVCAEASVPAANAAAVANPSDSADLLSIFVIAEAKRNQRFACGRLVQNLAQGARRNMSARGQKLT